MKTRKKCISFSFFVAKIVRCSSVFITEGAKRKKKPFPCSHSCAACFVKSQCEKLMKWRIGQEQCIIIIRCFRDLDRQGRDFNMLQESRQY